MPLNRKAAAWHHNAQTDRVTRCRSALHSCKQGPEDFHFATEAEAERYHRELQVALNDPAASLRFAFADSLVVPFTEGDCGWLALAISHLTSWKLHVVYGGLWEGADTAYNHFVVGLPDGRFLDVEGIRTRESLLDRYRVENLREVDYELIDFMLFDRYFEENPMGTARMILRFLRTMGWTIPSGAEIPQSLTDGLAGR